MNVRVIGAGLAGCEAAWALAQDGFSVTLVEQKPDRRSPAHRLDTFAELVCSNSLKAARVDSASGLLKAEMRKMGSLCLAVADGCAVPAGGALAVDRFRFTQGVTEKILSHAGITVLRREETALDPEQPTILATGPLTDGALAEALRALTGDEALSFYDAAAPIVTADSIDMEKVSAASRYGRGGDDYLNCFFDKAGYEAFMRALADAGTAPLHGADADYPVYEGCMPIEKLARRGLDAARFGPMKPVGLVDPVTGRRPWAAVQLRREDAAGTMYNLVGFQTNLRFGEQKRVFSMIPGLENAEFARYGVMHRNSFLNSPRVLLPTLSLRAAPNIRIAGQLTGFEGYMESAACGQLAARFAAAALRGRTARIPGPDTMCGALLRYITAPNSDFQPMGANMGILPHLAEPVRDKKQRYAALAERALREMEEYLHEDRD
ncbi:MAG: methylenetetrahydrofolate--tRNA-(uracil(54)-C(5))-methyltransferase (FADH(2)-oxidizing) TrmFO [Oscillospiraceae bacterium]|nr:methylenetetrahydrofolate--tRNA-(uracil(54)-C(5))-methyltransferase (FADH(2)-oxidizing) TrmFO [Oscillospiraceae bacterium]